MKPGLHANFRTTNLEMSLFNDLYSYIRMLSRVLIKASNQKLLLDVTWQYHAFEKQHVVFRIDSKNIELVDTLTIPFTSDVIMIIIVLFEHRTEYLCSGKRCNTPLTSASQITRSLSHCKQQDSSLHHEGRLLSIHKRKSESY